MRHAKAEPGTDDFARRLSEAGETDVQRIGEGLRSLGVSVRRIEHSPLVRAVETARIMGDQIEAPLIECADLRPDQDVAAVRDRLTAEQRDSVMVVGHNPFVERLAGLLIAVVTDRPVLTFHPASVARLVAISGGLGRRYICDWLITPDLLRTRA